MGTVSLLDTDPTFLMPTLYQCRPCTCVQCYAFCVGAFAHILRDVLRLREENSNLAGFLHRLECHGRKPRLNALVGSNCRSRHSGVYFCNFFWKIAFLVLESDKITSVPESILDHRCVAGVLLKSAN